MSHRTAKFVAIIVICGSFPIYSSGATLLLANGTDGTGELILAPFGTGIMDLRMMTASVDTIQVSFVNAFLDVTSNDVDVIAVNGGQEWTYDRTAFKLPAEISESRGNEYGLVSGSQDGANALPLGAAMWILDSLTLKSTTDVPETIEVTFELGARLPQVFGPPSSYPPFTLVEPSFPSGFPNFLYLGTGWDYPGYTEPFYITLIPEPGPISAMIVLALGLARRPRRSTIRIH